MNSNVIIWGAGKYLDEIKANIYNEEKKGNIKIIAVIGEVKSTDILGARNIKKEDIFNEGFDYVIIASVSFFDEIYKEAILIGIRQEQIVHGELLKQKGFDFELYRTSGWLTDNLFGNKFFHTEPVEASTILNRKNLRIQIDRMSTIGTAYIEDGGNPGNLSIQVGKFTNISWDCTFELGLNLDHSYTRVMNYGLTHLFNDYEMDRDACFEINIGSDVWIGRNVTIKSNKKIGDGAVIGSNSVVTENIPNYAIAIGNPAKVYKYRFDINTIEKLLTVKWWDWSLEKIRSYRSLIDCPNEFLECVIQKNK